MSDSNAASPARKKLGLHWQIIIGLLLGLVVGLIANLLVKNGSLPTEGAGAAVIGFVSKLNGFVGDLFLRMLKCVIIPLIIPSLVASVGSLDLR